MDDIVPYVVNMDKTWELDDLYTFCHALGQTYATATSPG
jgi:hypothetical protein